jgi:hypothetical protein
MADIAMAVPLLEALAPGKRLIADNAYDADRLRHWLQDRGIEAVIPGRAARAVIYPLNRPEQGSPNDCRLLPLVLPRKRTERPVSVARTRQHPDFLLKTLVGVQGLEPWTR